MAKKYLKNTIITLRENDVLLDRFTQTLSEMGISDKSKAFHWLIAKVITRDIVLNNVELRNTLNSLEKQ